MGRKNFKGGLQEGGRILKKYTVEKEEKEKIAHIQESETNLDLVRSFFSDDQPSETVGAHSSIFYVIRHGLGGTEIVEKKED